MQPKEILNDRIGVAELQVGAIGKLVGIRRRERGRGIEFAIDGTVEARVEIGRLPPCRP